MKSQREVEVRTIDGQSVRVSFEDKDTVQDLKYELQKLKLPPNFHLFLRGSKLDISSQIGSFTISEGDFIVLIPFTRKRKTKGRTTKTEGAEEAGENLIQGPLEARVGENDNPAACLSQTHPGTLAGSDADSIWHSIAADLAAANAASRDQEVDEGDLNTVKRKWTGDENSGENHGSIKLDNEDSKCGTLVLPPGLEKLRRVFTSLNTVCGFLQRQHMQATWQNVREALQQLCCAEGESVTVEDIHHLGILCPKLVVLSNLSGEGEESSFFIDLFDPFLAKKQEELGKRNVSIATNMQEIGPSDFLPNAAAGGKRLSDRAIKIAVTRRQKVFEKSLADVLQYIQNNEKTTSGVNESSVEDYLTVAKELMKDEIAKQALKAPLPRPPRGHKKLVRCTSVGNLAAFEMVEHLKQGLGSLGQIVHCERMKAREAVYGQLKGPLSYYASAALKQMGISKLYFHQAEAINSAREGRDVIVATSTASGKSLCYNIPVLEELYKNEDSCALYLFPTKALAQDQLRALQEMLSNIEPQPVMGVYDGDTPQDHRLLLRDTGRLLITNPDMLHVSILPSHRQFTRFLSNLRYLVIDEAHAYRGVFGCHTALILRRLRRLCSHLYGTEPTFIICSATVANPSGHAQELVGLRKVEVVQTDGSPCGDKLFLLWNSPTIFVPPPSVASKNQRTAPAKPSIAPLGEIMKKRSSPIVEVATLFAEMVQHGLRCIAFCRSRKLCELVYNYTQEILKETAPELVDLIRSYRGGYTARERRNIESELFGGKLRGVAATNALELGVDVGSLDATLHLGFPGTVASLWQQSGRAGRREKVSLAIYVAFGGPLDQHFMKNPCRLFQRPIENAQVDANNQQVVEQHIACSAVEYPLHVAHDEEYFGSGLKAAISELVKQGILGRHPGNGPKDISWHYIGQEKMPSQGVSIRAINPEKYRVIDIATNEIIEEIEENKAFFQVYEGAVYMNQGKTYLVRTLDLNAKVALCRVADLKYYTKTRDFTGVHVTGGELAYPRHIVESKYRSSTAQASTCDVTTRWIGFRRIWQGSNEQFDSVDLFLPDISYESQAAWIRVPSSIRAELESLGLCFRAGLHAACHALLNVMPLYIMCNPSDLGTDCANPKDTRYYPERLLVFDRHPGGIGIAAQARPMFAELLQAAMELLVSCECSTDDGCPCCVQYLNCSEYNEVINKRAARLIIEGVVKAEEIYRETRERASCRADGFIETRTH